MLPDNQTRTLHARLLRVSKSEHAYSFPHVRERSHQNNESIRTNHASFACLEFYLGYPLCLPEKKNKGIHQYEKNKLVVVSIVVKTTCIFSKLPVHTRDAIC